jgi:DNA (cytosine-5)-methyltransferase 1
VLDLFAGCGGISLGFEAAGFTIVGGVEKDSLAAATHGRNFHPGGPAPAIDITTTSPEAALESLRPELAHSAGDAIDVLVGGPPCQAFARVGRSKLRDLAKRAGHAEAHRAWEVDERVDLYRSYLRYIEVLRPLVVLLENVPDMLNHGGRNLAAEFCEALPEGYRARYGLLNAVHYGVPQMRERAFVLAWHECLGRTAPTFPEATHGYELPRGYFGTRATATKLVDRLFPDDHWLEVARPGLGATGAVTARDAIGDLPPLLAEDLLARSVLRRGPRDLRDPLGTEWHRRPVLREAVHAYQRLMREWPGHEARHAAPTAHVIRYLPRDYQVFAAMEAGDEYPRAVQVARSLGVTLPYDASKFPNKWWKLHAGQPVRTLMAHLGKDSYSHIHYDDAQARTISVREAARLQSFPDGFEFEGSMNAGFRQIGNAVPPLLAHAFAVEIWRAIRRDEPTDLRHEFGLLSAQRARTRRA